MSDYTVDPGIRSSHSYEGWTPEQSNLVQHSEFELRAAGLFNEGSDHDGMLGQAVMELAVLFASQNHSGASASIVLAVFEKVAAFENLTPITDNPEDWIQVHDGLVGPDEPPFWQCRRKSSLFSHDGGKTYYDLNEPLQSNGAPTMFNAKEYASA